VQATGDSRPNAEETLTNARRKLRLAEVRARRLVA
jgi:hypothetical protein